MNRNIASSSADNVSDVIPNTLEFPVVGIGASAGGLQALVRLFENMPRDCGMAFVVVVHLSPKHDSHVDQILQRSTKMPVLQVNTTVPIQKDHVYVISPAVNLQMNDGHLTVAAAERPREGPIVVDLFFRTLAEAHKNRAVAIVLSGTGADGSLGMARIKEQGGVNLAQLPSDAQFDGMPRNAIESNAVDFVLPVADIPQKLLEITSNAKQIRLPRAKKIPLPAKEPTSEEEAQTAERALVDVLKLLSTRTGHDFKHYKRATVLRRLERRMQVRAVNDIPQYLEVLKQQPDETSALLGDMLIGVTNFFRDREAFDALEREVIPDIFAQAESDGLKEIRVWTVACSTGEEVYSVAIVLEDEAQRRQSEAKLQVFATDLDDRAIARARRAVYPEAIVTDVPATYLRQYFRKEDHLYHIAKRIRERVVFATHNVLRDPPFSRLQMITCRNLLIYLDQHAQLQILNLFHSVLSPGGYLFLGSSETADVAEALFTTVDKKNRIYRAVPSGQGMYRPSLSAEKGIALARAARVASPIPRAGKPTSYSALHQFALEKYGPPTILIDRNFRVVHMSERAGDFIRHVSGEPSHNLLTLITPELRVGLHTAVLEAVEKGQPARTRHIRNIGTGVDTIVVASPFRRDDSDEQLLLITFEPFVSPALPDDVTSEGSPADTVIKALESDNEALRTQLQDTVERFTRTTEELKTSNEEFQAINEELRSATEELETSKEELESINEELVTVNDELKIKVDETSKVNNDLQNLISSGDIATIFVDRHMRVKWFTPKAVSLFNLLAGDMGRKLSDITHRLNYPTMIADAQESFRTLRHIEHEVRDSENHWYLARILPYRTTEDLIEGAVLNFVDITARKIAEQRLYEGLERLRLVAESTKDYAIITLDESGIVTGWNLAAEVIFGYKAAEMQGGPLDRIYTPEDRAACLPALELKTALERGHGEDERWHMRKDGSRFYCSGVVFPMIDGGLRGYAKIARDLTDKRMEAEKQALTLEHTRAANLLKDEFLTIMSHELRHPLNLIELNMELLSRTPEIKKSQKAAMAIEAVRRSVHNQSQIISDLLDFSRVQTGKLKLERAPMRLITSVRSVIQSASAQARKEQITLQTHGLDAEFEDAFILEGDPTRIEQMIWNLLSNALKFTPAGGTITVSLSREHNEARLDVTDTGIGIAPQSIRKVFDMFSQIEQRPGQRRQHGLGIGLALVSELAEAHGGRVAAASRGEGQGSTFTLWLPLIDALQDVTLEPAQQADSSRLQGLRVLLVDDAEEILEMLGSLCEMEGADVTTAANGLLALERLAEEDFDVLVSDLGMPTMDGYELLTRLRRSTRNASIPAIALSGYGPSLKATAVGFTYQLYKPVPMNEFINLLSTVAGGKEDTQN